MQPARYRGQDILVLSKHLTLRNATNKQTLEALWNFSRRKENAINTAWRFSHSKRARTTYSRDTSLLPQHAIKITRKIPTVKFLNPPDAVPIEFHRDRWNRIEFYSKPIPLLYKYPLKKISNIVKRTIFFRKMVEIIGISRVFAANYHRRPSYLAALFNHDAIITSSPSARILDTRESFDPRL